MSSYTVKLRDNMHTVGFYEVSYTHTKLGGQWMTICKVLKGDDSGYFFDTYISKDFDESTEKAARGVYNQILNLPVTKLNSHNFASEIDSNMSLKRDESIKNNKDEIILFFHQEKVRNLSLQKKNLIRRDESIKNNKDEIILFFHQEKIRNLSLQKKNLIRS
jgi:hypothetical protein